MRTPTPEETAIIKKKEKRMDRELMAHVKSVEYRTAFPRSTICILGTILNPTVDATTIGISMRGKKDPDVPAVGEVQAFVRALNAL